MAINYINGDATYPIGDGNKMIVHVCNNIGAWGAGFVLAISKRWKEPESRFKMEYKMFGRPIMGSCQPVEVEEDIYVMSMICQQGIAYKGRKDAPIRYDELEYCLNGIANASKQYGNASIHMPRIGCGLAGGKWEEVEAIINRTLINKGVEVFVYDYGV